MGRYVLSVIGSQACESGGTGAGRGRQMLERITDLKRLKPPVWSAAFVIALSLIAIALLSACGDETKPASTPNPASTLTPASGNTSTPAIGPTPTSTPTIVPTVSTASDELRSTKERAAPTATPTIVPAVPTASDELHSTKERAAPAATAAELAELADGNSAFAFDLYRSLGAEDGNLFYSPYSISLALAMTYAGARGETERQMADTLHYLLPQERLHTSFNSLDLELASMADAPEEESDAFTLNLANAVWGQHDYEFLAPFLDVLAENYGAGVRPTDFVGSPEESRVRINDWVAEQTEDKVEDLIPEDAIDRSTRMVLTNAIYFNARWFHPFFKHLTSARLFHLLDGSKVDVPMMMMAAAERFGYADGDGYQAVELPYRGRDMWMTILLPDAGAFREFEESMDADLIAGILGDIEREYVELTMPKFEFESEFSLKETLKAMGMPNAFDGFTADFSGMDGRSCPGVCLLISDAFHKAFVSVDEEGTEAAAATGVVVILESARPTPKKVMVDRPFIFLIRDRATDAILFVGRVENPVG